MSVQAVQSIAALALLALVRATSLLLLSAANPKNLNKEVAKVTSKVWFAGLMASAVVETAWAIGTSGAATALSASAQCPAR